MKAIKIDAENQLVGVVELAPGIKDIYKHLGLGCDCFTAPVVFKNDDTLYVDDEGLIRGPAPCGFTLLTPDGTFWKFIGNGLVIGCDQDGESVDFKSKIDDICDMIHWMDKTDAGIYQAMIGY